MTTSLRVGLVSLVLLAAHSGLVGQPPQPPNGPQPAPYPQQQQQPEVYGQPPLEGQPTADGQEAEDVPGRGVARISVLNGEVSVKRGDSGDVIAAAINAPLVASDRILTGPGARTELQLDNRNRLRIAADSDLHLAEIENRRYAVELGRGTLTWHITPGSVAEIDINTPSVSIRPTQPGDYRVTVNEDGTTTVTARTGEAEIYSPRGVEKVRRGKTTLVRGERTDPEFQTIAEIREDEWDRFNLDRDHELDRSESAQYLPEGVMGGEELDQNGQWVDSAPYGRVWQPRVAADWSPYSQGRWSWTDYYGWTWVSYDQFGWAPFHYGSWFNAGGRWCWYPGARQQRTWWRPAMVAWFGFGSVRVGVGFGNWGWVPLAPFERYRPWYGRGYYGNNRTNIHANIRIVNNYNIANNYRNARVLGGARSIEAGQFGRAGIGRYDRVGEANLRSAGLMHGQLPASPTRESLAFNNRQVNGNIRGGYEGAFYNRRPSVAQERIPFAEQQRGIERGARGFAGGSLNAGTAGRGDNAFRGDNGMRGAGSGTRADNGWRRVGERPAQGNGDAVRGGDSSVRGGQQPENSNGWRRFGEPSAQDGARGSVRGGAAPGSGREVDSSVRGGNGNQRSDGNGWRRFGEPSTGSGQPRNSETEGVRGGGREFGRNNEGNSADSGTRGYRQRQELSPDPSLGQPRSSEFVHDTGSRGSVERNNSGNRPDSIRVNPPVLRDRSDSGVRGQDPSASGGNQYRSVPPHGGSSVRENGGGSAGRVRGDGGNSGSGGMRSGGSPAPSGGHSNGSRASEGGGARGGGGHRRN